MQQGSEAAFQYGHSVSIDGTPNERARELGLDALKTVTMGFAWLLQEALG